MSNAITEDDWAEWAKEEIIALHENIKKRDAKIVELEKLCADLIAQAACAREQGAREALDTALRRWKTDWKENDFQEVKEFYMQLWREGRK